MQSYSSPFINTLDADDLKKLFPQSYYTKYATHLRILQFEKATLEEVKSYKKLNFKSRKRVQSDKKYQTKKVKISRYDDYKLSISKNKQQIVRMNRYTQQLGQKLLNGPIKQQGIIRIQKQQVQLPEQNIITRMKFMQDDEHLQKMKKLKKRKEEKCNFIKNQKAKSLVNLPSFSKIYQTQSIVYHQKPSDKQKVQKMQTELRNLINNSQILTKSLNPQMFAKDQRSYIVNINKALKKSLKIIQTAGYQHRDNFVSNLINGKKALKKEDAEQIIKNLQIETIKIKDQVKSMKVIKVGQQHQHFQKIRSYTKNNDNT